MFRVSFDQALSPVIFEEIDEARDRLRREEFRVVVRMQDELLKEGIEVPKDGEPEKISIKYTKFSGDKWGGKYLRAPDIFYTILEKGKDKLVRLGDIAEVRFGIKTGANEFFYLDEERINEWGIEEEFLKSVIKSPRECKSILVDQKDLKFNIFMCNKAKSELRGTNALKYIKWGEGQGFNKVPSVRSRKLWYGLGLWGIPDLIWSDAYGDRYACYRVPDGVLADKRFFYIYPKEEYLKSFDSVRFFLNSSITALFTEIEGIVSLGEGVLYTNVYWLKKLPVLLSPKISGFKKYNSKKVESIFNECGFDRTKDIRSQKPIPISERKQLDDIVFDLFALTKNERNEVYWSICEIVQNRLMKARSV